MKFKRKTPHTPEASLSASRPAAAGSPLPAAAPQTAAEVEKLLDEWRRLYDLDTREILKLEKAGTIAKKPRDLEPIERNAGLTLLQGGQLTELPTFEDPGTRLTRLLARRQIVGMAIEAGNSLYERLSVQESADRFHNELREPYSAIMRQVATAIIEIEHALQERDRLLAQLHPSARMQPGSQWKFLGRLTERGMNASQAFMFLELASKEKWISEKQFRTEVEASVRADRETVR